MGEHEQVIQRYVACFSRQDWAGLVECLTDDVEREEVGHSGFVRGKKEFAENMRPPPEVDTMRMEVSRMTEEGDVVVSEGTVHLSKKDGSSFKVRFCDIFEFGRDKIRRLSGFAAVV